jgi:hypothetical protein
MVFYDNVTGAFTHGVTPSILATANIFTGSNTFNATGTTSLLGPIKMTLPSTITSSMLYYNTVTGVISQGLTPSILATANIFTGNNTFNATGTTSLLGPIKMTLPLLAKTSMLYYATDTGLISYGPVPSILATTNIFSSRNTFNGETYMTGKIIATLPNSISNTTMMVVYNTNTGAFEKALRGTNVPFSLAYPLYLDNGLINLGIDSNLLKLDVNNKLTLNQATNMQDGYLSSVDYASIFSSIATKQDIISVTSPIAFNNNFVSIAKSSLTSDGYLSSVDYTYFNDKVDTVSASISYEPESDPTIIATRTNNGININLNMPYSSDTFNGMLSSTDFNTFQNKENVLTFSTPLSRTGNTISINQATNSQNGYLSFGDWLTFAGKQDVFTTSLPLLYNTSTKVLTIYKASISSNGYLGSTEFITFNNKVSSVSLPTNLDGSTNPSAIQVDNTDPKNPTLSLRVASPLIQSRTEGLKIDFAVANTWTGNQAFDGLLSINNGYTMSKGNAVFNSGQMYFNSLPTSVGDRILSHQLSSGEVRSITPAQFYAQYPPVSSNIPTTSGANVFTGTNTFNTSIIINDQSKMKFEIGNNQTTQYLLNMTSTGVVGYMDAYAYKNNFLLDQTNVWTGTNTFDLLFLKMGRIKFTTLNNLPYGGGTLLCLDAFGVMGYTSSADFYTNFPPPSSSPPGVAYLANVQTFTNQCTFSTQAQFPGGLNCNGSMAYIQTGLYLAGLSNANKSYCLMIDGASGYISYGNPSGGGGVPSDLNVNSVTITSSSTSALSIPSGGIHIANNNWDFGRCRFGDGNYAYIAEYDTGDSDKLYFWGANGIYANNNITVVSDRRVKENIETFVIDNPLDMIEKIRLV